MNHPYARVFPGPAARSSRFSVRLLLNAVAATLSIVAATLFAPSQPAPVFAESAAAAPVVGAAAKLESLVEEIPLPASAFAWKESSVSAQVDGLVVELLVDDGDPVEKGDLLIRLDDTIANLNSRQAKAALAESRADYEDSLRQLEEASKLVEKRHIAMTTYESLIAGSKIKQAVRDRLSAEYNRAAEIAGRYRIPAPFDGVVGQVPVEIGQWIETGETAVQLFDVETLKIRAQVPQRFFSSIDTGTPVSIRFDALADLRFDAAVSRKIPVGSQVARTFPVRIDLPNPNRRIAPGMSATIRFRINPAGASPVLTVPRDAVVTAPDGSESVWKINPAGDGFTVAPVNVSTGRFFEESVEITDGSIRAGNLVVVRGNEILQTGQAVRLIGGPAD